MRQKRHRNRCQILPSNLHASVVKSACQSVCRRPSTRVRVELKTNVSATVTAWAAGVFEGEGSILIRKMSSGLPSLLISIANTDIDLLAPFPENWFHGNIVSGRSSLKGNARRSWRWALSTHQAAHFIRDLYPYFVTPRFAVKLNSPYSSMRTSNRGGATQAPMGSRTSNGSTCSTNRCAD